LPDDVCRERSERKFPVDAAAAECGRAFVGMALRDEQMQSITRWASCPFCHNSRKPLAQNESAFAIYDAFPVSPGHALVIAKRHVDTIFDLDAEEYAACFALVREMRDLLEERQQTKDFNLGVNCGEVAGQTISHAHIHLIPRYNPRGGVRHVIPGKSQY
jgi:diadenosine tetraphosphate (Ap4A) HIT family hydrolase